TSPVMQIRSLSLTVLLAIVGTACKRQPAPEEQAPAPPSLPPQAVASATPKADTVGWGWDSPEAARLSGVRYAPPRQVFGTLGSYFERENWRAWTAAFATSGLTLVSDSTFAVRPFLPSDTISYAANTFRRVSRSCGDSSRRVAFRHPVLQNVRFDGQLFHSTR